jgi:glycosyltransferase involved in cell wall biosynthesis
VDNSSKEARLFGSIGLWKEGENILMYLTIVIPAYNEEGNVELLCNEIKGVLHGLMEYEIILVDDGSTDLTYLDMKNAMSNNKVIKIIKLKRNYKKSVAYMVGIEEAEGDVIITMDADRQDDPNEIPSLLEKINSYDAVIGWKKNRKDTISKKIPSKIFNYINKVMFGVELKDNDSGFRALKRSAAKSLDLYGDLYRFIPALLVRNGYSVTEVGVNHRKRLVGKSKFGNARLLTGLLDIITTKLLIDYSSRPSHYFGIVGFLFIMFGVSAEGYVLLHKLIGGDLFSTHMPMMIFGVLMLIVGVLFIGFGILSELIVIVSRPEKHIDYVVNK